uniref:Vacuolar protein sorting-associated protein 29 n=1 Tax=Rhabditophanes sp. KR3021 TaxID=114890 RepID=A0AC35U8I4_9BILA
MLVLIIGDFHIPHKAFVVPSKFRKLLVPNKIQHILCTGNLCSKETLDYLRTLATDVQVVRGDLEMDSTYPFTKVINVGEFQIGLTHGHQIIPWGDAKATEAVARQLNVDVFISGHTHICSNYEKDGVLFLNPGSVTGSPTIFDDSPQTSIPSFVLMDVQGDSISTYVYKIVDDAKSDQNNDYYLDKLELKTFIRKIVKRVPEIYKGTKYSVDALEGSSVLAEDLFKKHDKNRDGKLSFRGSLVKKSEATVFGDLIEKVVVNLMHEISNITPPYKGLNPFD